MVASRTGTASDRSRLDREESDEHEIRNDVNRSFEEGSANIFSASSLVDVRCTASGDFSGPSVAASFAPAVKRSG